MNCAWRVTQLEWSLGVLGESRGVLDGHVVPRDWRKWVWKLEGSRERMVGGGQVRK